MTPAPDGAPWKTLDEWHLFADAAKQVPAKHVIPYDVIAPLYADYASKHRFLYVPEGAHVGYSATETWSFPVGTILVKTFSYLADARDDAKGERLLETRLLIHEKDGWVPHTYAWNVEQTAATLAVGGDTVNVEFTDVAGKTRTNAYNVPSENDCRNCHGRLGHTGTLGGRTRQFDRDHDYGDGPENQVDHLAKLGLFDTAPDAASARQRLVDPFGTAPIFDRVRSYFDGNCAHCHQPGDHSASVSGLWLDFASTDPASGTPATFGFCKQPASAGGATCGRQFDVVPGKPDDSILICRVESTLPKVRMPSVGRNLVHTEAVALLREWIQTMKGACGAPPPPDAGTPDAGTPDAGTPDASPRDASSGD